MRIFANLNEFSALAGQSLGHTPYLTITQAMVDQFAEATGDRQWIHTDPARARAESPFGAPIAHGFLTLSLAPQLLASLYRIDSVKIGINYGANRIRFMQSVPVDSQLRLQATLKQVEPQPAPAGQSGLRATFDCVFERAGSDKPVCVAELITLFFE